MKGPRKYIAIAGNIGAGKSTLTQFLHARFNLAPFYEPNEENPFLKLFYSDMKRWAFHSQLFFLTHKFRLHQELLKHPGAIVQDRTIYEDAEIFAENLFRSKLMTKEEYATYRSLYEAIIRSLRPPDLMIYLQASVGTLRRRIKHRGRPEEQELPIQYIRQLQDLYEAWFQRYDRSPTLIIPVDRLDYVHNQNAQDELIESIKAYL